MSEWFRVERFADPLLEVYGERSSLAVLYPDARVEPFEPVRRRATAAEAVALRRDIEMVLSDAPEEWDDAHELACENAPHSVSGWRELAGTANGDGEGFPLLPTCRECARWLPQTGRCKAAERRHLHGCHTQYTPVPDLGRRCDQFQKSTQ